MTADPKVREELARQIQDIVYDHNLAMSMPQGLARKLADLVLARERAAAGKARADAELLREALEELHQWSEAYPTEIFIEPTDEQWRQAHEALQSVGMTIDKLSGSIYRRILRRTKSVTTRALAHPPAQERGDG